TICPDVQDQNGRARLALQFGDPAWFVRLPERAEERADTVRDYDDAVRREAKQLFDVGGGVARDRDDSGRFPPATHSPLPEPQLHGTHRALPPIRKIVTGADSRPAEIAEVAGAVVEDMKQRRSFFEEHHA